MLISEAELRLMLNMTGTDVPQDELMALQQAHAESEALVKDYLKYDPEQRPDEERIEFYPRADPVGSLGRDWNPYWDNFGISSHMGPSQEAKTKLQVLSPIRKIISIRVNVNGKFGATDELQDRVDSNGQPVANPNQLTEGEDFHVAYDFLNYCRDGIIHGNWPRTPGSIRVKYVGGYTPAELNGKADLDAVQNEANLGFISSEHVNAAGIKRAVWLTVAKAMQTYAATKRMTNRGFTGGNIYESETLQDYSYKRPSDGSATQLSGMKVALPDEAILALDRFRNYGIIGV